VFGPDKLKPVAILPDADSPPARLVFLARSLHIPYLKVDRGKGIMGG